MKSSAGRASQANARARSTSGVASGCRGRDDLRDPGHGRVHGDRVAGVEAGEEHPQAVLVGAPQPGEPGAALGLAPAPRAGPGSASMTLASATSSTRPAPSLAIIRDIAESTSPTLSAPRWRESLAIRRASQTSHSPRRHTAQVSGSRCCRSSTSASALRDAIAPVPRASAISPRQKSCTPGVPSPPTWTSTLPDPTRHGPVGALGRVGGVHRRPLREHLEVVDLRQPAGPHDLARSGEEPAGIEVGQVVEHVFDPTGTHRHPEPLWTPSGPRAFPRTRMPP